MPIPTYPPPPPPPPHTHTHTKKKKKKEEEKTKESPIESRYTLYNTKHISSVFIIQTSISCSQYSQTSWCEQLPPEQHFHRNTMTSWYRNTSRITDPLCPSVPGIWGLIFSLVIASTNSWTNSRSHVKPTTSMWSHGDAVECGNRTRAMFLYPIRHLIVRSHKVSKSWALYVELSDRFEIWQAHQQHCCQGACQISKRCVNLNYQSRGFETSWDLTTRRLIWYLFDIWNRAKVVNVYV